jgi:tetratricopeptide (TPR) repeat protein
VAAALVAALDHWAAVRRGRDAKAPGWVRVLAAARAADPDPDRDALRAALLVADRAARLGRLRPLAARAGAGSWAPASLVLLGEALADAGDLEAGVAVLRRASWAHPEDARVHFTLAYLLERVRPPQPEEAIRAYAIAWARQPELAGHDLARALERRGRGAEAEAVWRDLVGRRPDDGRHLVGYGSHLADRGRGAEAAPVLARAIAALRAAIHLQPDFANPHTSLGIALRASGDLKGAIAAHRAAIRLQPDLAMAHTNLGGALHDAGDLPGAIAAHRAAIRLQPDLAMAHYNLGLALHDAGDLPGAIAAFHDDIRLRPDHAPAHCGLGLALRQQGRYAESLAEYRLGHELGSKRADWRHPSAAWVKEAERLAARAERLPAVLGGTDRPADNAERLEFAQMCYDTKRYAGAARLWSEALEADPRLAEDRRAGHRYNAACAAARAAAGQDRHDPPPDAAARAVLRDQALAWLRAELGAWSRLGDEAASTPGRLEASRSVSGAMLHWREDGDLASVRDPAALAELPEAERADWRALWADVDALLAEAEAAGFRAALRLRPDEAPSQAEGHYLAALARLAADPDGDDYRASARSALDRLGRTDDAETAFHVARAGALAPGVTDRPDRLVALAEKAVAADPKAAWRLYVLGLANYRAGRYEEAVRRLDESAAADPSWSGRAQIWPVLALAHHRLGHADLAMRRLAQAERADAESIKFWWDRMEFRQLRREAQAALRDAIVPADPFVR